MHRVIGGGRYTRGIFQVAGLADRILGADRTAQALGAGVRLPSVVERARVHGLTTDAMLNCLARTLLVYHCTAHLLRVLAGSIYFRTIVIFLRSAIGALVA